MHKFAVVMVLLLSTENGVYKFRTLKTETLSILKHCWIIIKIQNHHQSVKNSENLKSTPFLHTYSEENSNSAFSGLLSERAVTIKLEF